MAVWALSGCTMPAQVDPRDQMVGMSEGQLADCMGEPANKQSAGPSETWTYYRPDGTNTTAVDPVLMPRSQPFSDLSANACMVTVKLEADKVMSVDYADMTSATEDAECAQSLQRCTPPQTALGH